MRRNAVGFYWTYPVEWAGFAKLPKNVDEAAARSKTIRYQRDLIRRYVDDGRLNLVHEEVFLETEPDRGSQHIVGPLKKVANICRAKDAVLLLVHFSVVHGWRDHASITYWLGNADIKFMWVYPDEIIIDGRPFDPHAHFRRWRDIQHERTAEKFRRAAIAMERAKELRVLRYTYERIAAILNAEQIGSPTGKLWKEDNVRKLIKGWPWLFLRYRSQFMARIFRPKH